MRGFNYSSFISTSDYYIFVLTQLNISDIKRILGINKDLYNSRNAAKDWRDKIISKIEFNSINWLDGVNKANEIYLNMIK